MNQSQPRTAARAPPGRLQHGRREVAAGHLVAEIEQREGPVPVAAGDIERPLAEQAVAAGERDQFPHPGAVGIVAREKVVHGRQDVIRRTW